VFLVISVEQRVREMSDGVPAAATEEPCVLKSRRGVLTVVDLAGSERVAKSGSEGVRLEEVRRE